MAENFSIEHSRTKITEVKKTIEDKKQKLDELKQQKKSLMDAGLALDSSNLDSAVQATLMESINDSLRDVENKAYAMQVYLDKYLHENFGDLYTTKIKNCGAVLSNEVEYEPSVYIEATDSAKYPWLSFVVTGEQLTMTQVSFAIYALYLPTKDSQCTQAVDTIEQNQKYQNRLITLKQAQNPKIKNYIESINEILISGLEAWLNNNNTSSMYD